MGPGVEVDDDGTGTDEEEAAAVGADRVLTGGMRLGRTLMAKSFRKEDVTRSDFWPGVMRAALKNLAI